MPAAFPILPPAISAASASPTTSVITAASTATLQEVRHSPEFPDQFDKVFSVLSVTEQVERCG